MCANCWKPLVLIGLVYTLVNLATVRFYIEGPSMQPNFWAGQFLIVSRVNYMLGNPQRGDIVVFDPPGDDGTADDPLLIKRLIGLPGEHLEFSDGQVYINGTALNEPYIKEACRVSSVVTVEPGIWARTNIFSWATTATTAATRARLGRSPKTGSSAKRLSVTGRRKTGALSHTIVSRNRSTFTRRDTHD